MRCHRLISFGRWLLSRTVTVVLLSGMAFLLLVPSSTISRSQGAALSRLQPRYRHLNWYVLGQEEPNRQEFQECVHFLSHVIRLLPHNSDAYAFMGYSQYILGHRARAIQAYERATELNPHYFWSHYSLGALYLDAGDYERAIKLFQRAVGLRPDMTLAMVMTAQVYAPLIKTNLLQSQGYAFGEELREAVYRAHQGIVLAYFYQQDYQHVFAHAVTAKEIYGPRHFVPYRFSYFAGRAAYEINDQAKALYYLQKAVMEHPQDAEAFYYLGLSLQKRGESVYSEQALQKALALRQNQGALPERDPRLVPQLF